MFVGFPSQDGVTIPWFSRERVRARLIAVENAPRVSARPTKTGAGRLTLSHANSYTGASTIKGLLAVTNKTGSATGTARVQVNAATLGGTGRISGAVAVGTAMAAGVLAPGLGTTPGTLTLLNSVTSNSASSYKVCPSHRECLSPYRVPPNRALRVLLGCAPAGRFEPSTAASLRAG